MPCHGIAPRLLKVSNESRQDLSRASRSIVINHHKHSAQPARNWSRQKAETLRSLALVLIKRATWKDLALALRHMRESASLFRKAQLNDRAAADYLSMGEIYFTWSRYPLALSAYHRALRLAQNHDPDMKCSILSHIAVAEATIGEVAQSLKYSRKALNLDASSLAKAEASVALGLALLYSQDPRQAVDLLQSAEVRFSTIGDKDAQARALFYMGVAALETGTLKEAFEEEERALDLWISVGNAHGIAEVHLGLGLLHITAGEPDKALAEYRQARQIFQTIGDRDSEGVVLNGLGVVSTELGDHEMALLYHTQARISFASVGDRLGELSAVASAAKAEWSLHRYSEAARLYDAELRRAHRAQNYRVEASALFNLGDVHEHDHNYTKAEILYGRSLGLCRSAHNAFGEIEVLLRFGRLYAETGRYPQALQSFKSALKLADSIGQVAKQAQTHYELARLHQALQQFDEAKAQAENATAIIESERTKVSDFDSRATYFASVHQYYQLYIDVLLRLHEQNPSQDFAQRAFEASEKSKVRSLLDMLASSGTESTCDTGQQSDACAHTATTALTLDQIQADIRGDDAVVLEYALGPESSQLWVVDDGHMHSYRLPSETQISRLAASFRKTLIARQPLAHEDAVQYSRRVARADSQLAEVSQQLSQVLLGPAREWLNRKRVIFVPDGALQYIPFAALPLPAPTGTQNPELLWDKHELVTLPSASTLKALRDVAGKRLQSERLAAVFADPVFSKDDPRLSQHYSAASAPHPPILGTALRDTQFGSGAIPRLPASRKEAQNIASAFPESHILLAMDFDASRKTVLSMDLRQYRYIHFATHGILDSTHPEFSGLILSLVNRNGQPEDGYLRMRDIYSLKLAADLVVLSSCNSALGKDLQSEGIIGLTRAFLSAGSQRVISTLWKVNDEATAQFMEYFYSRLHAGEIPSSALRGAQSDLAKDPQWRHPYYWAAFILQGDYR